MANVFKFYKRRFRNALQPVFVMLIARKPAMAGDQWREYVHNTRSRIIVNPHEFLGADVPEQSLIRDIIDELFSEFLKFKDKEI